MTSACFHQKLVTPLELDSYWPRVVRYVSDALKHSRGEITTQDCYKLLKQNLMFLWVVEYNDSSEIPLTMITELQSYPQFDVARIVVLSGHDMKMYAHLWPYIEEWAKGVGAKYLEAYARRGFVRAANFTGMKEIYTVVSKELK